jgi:membrane-associated phospholipid phosphatase
VTLLGVVLQVVAVVVVLLVLGLRFIAPFGDVRRALQSARVNVRSVGSLALVFGVILAANGLVRDAGSELSWLIGLNITRRLYSLEGQFVATVQSFATPELTAFFGFMYVFGYAFLLVFPIVMYLFHDETEPLSTTLVAYSLNYVLGLVCYVLFVAYGPRNLMPELVESLLYASWPQSQLLTSQINVNTNVFPSLHASLAVTVAAIAYRFRETHRRWYPVAVFLATSICVSTMYLGIHWLLDVVGGVVLALLCVSVAARLVAVDVHRRPTFRTLRF